MSKPTASDYRRVLRALVDAVQAFGEAKFFDDEKEMERSGAKVDRRMREARNLLNRTAPNPSASGVKG